MAKVVYNNCYGGFGLSDRALALYNSRVERSIKYTDQIKRDDPVLVSVVEQLGADADGHCAKLKIKNVPKDTFWAITGHDGKERVETRTFDGWTLARD